MGRIGQWWGSREPREQKLLAVLSGMAALFLILFGLILPLQSAHASSQAKLDRAKANLALVSTLSPAQAGAAIRQPFDRSVLITVARAQNVKLTRVQPGNDGSFSIWIDEAETPALYGFFEVLLSSYAVNLERVVVSTDANERLSAQFTVRDS